VAGLSISNSNYDTVGGWVLDLFGRVPHKGEKKETTGVRVAVEKVERTRVLEILVTLPDATSHGDAA
jgi:CBS domain containing-hemolysin-like protein